MHFQTGSGNVKGRDLSGRQGQGGQRDIEIEEMARATSISARARQHHVSESMVDSVPKRAAATSTAKAAQEYVERAHRFGKCNAQWPSDAAFDVDISSSSGSVTLGHPVTTTVQGRFRNRRRVWWARFGWWSHDFRAHGVGGCAGRLGLFCQRRSVPYRFEVERRTYKALPVTLCSPTGRSPAVDYLCLHLGYHRPRTVLPEGFACCQTPATPGAGFRHADIWLFELVPVYKKHTIFALYGVAAYGHHSFDEKTKPSLRKITMS